MKRIIFYVAAVGIFVSSVLAKPARGASPGIEWFPGQGPWMTQGTELQEPETQPVQTKAPGEEWFPGQGPWMTQGAEMQEPETQPVQTKAPGEEWFPGQGPWMAQGTEIQEPETQPPQTQPSETEPQMPQTHADPWEEWFPWQNFWQDWQEWQSGGSGWQQGGQDDFWGNGDDGEGTASYITRIAELVNEQRGAAGLAPVTVSAALSAAADVRAQEIVGTFSHYRPNGTYFNTVLDQRGIAYNGAGENIAYGYDTPERVMSEWMNSPGHRANILDSRFTKLGVGYYESGGVKYWTQLFTR